jgi:hypothetical protein
MCCKCATSPNFSAKTPLLRHLQDVGVISPLLSFVLRHTLMISNISILAEIPEDLHETLKGYLESHPDWDQDRVFSAALSLFLMQNGDCDRRAARVYLDTLFNKAVR